PPAARRGGGGARRGVRPARRPPHHACRGAAAYQGGPERDPARRAHRCRPPGGPGRRPRPAGPAGGVGEGRSQEIADRRVLYVTRRAHERPCGAQASGARLHERVRAARRSRRVARGESPDRATQVARAGFALPPAHCMSRNAYSSTIAPTIDRKKPAGWKTAPSRGGLMRRPISPPTKEPAIPSNEVAISPMWSAPGMTARATRPRMNPVRTDQMTCAMAGPPFGAPRLARIDPGDNPWGYQARTAQVTLGVVAPTR